MASPHRRQILEMVWADERTAGHLAEALDLAPASISEHLKVLRKLGLVELRVDGTFRHYRAQPLAIARLESLLQATFPRRDP